MLLDAEKQSILEGVEEHTWQYSLKRISSGMKGVSAMCEEAIDAFSTCDVACEGDEPTPWDDVVRVLGEAKDLIDARYHGF